MGFVVFLRNTKTGNVSWGSSRDHRAKILRDDFGLIWGHRNVKVITRIGSFFSVTLSAHLRSQYKDRLVGEREYDLSDDEIEYIKMKEENREPKTVDILTIDMGWLFEGLTIVSYVYKDLFSDISRIIYPMEQFIVKRHKVKYTGSKYQVIRDFIDENYPTKDNENNIRKNLHWKRRVSRFYTVTANSSRYIGQRRIATIKKIRKYNENRGPRDPYIDPDIVKLFINRAGLKELVLTK